MRRYHLTDRYHPERIAFEEFARSWVSLEKNERGSYEDNVAMSMWAAWCARADKKIAGRNENWRSVADWMPPPYLPVLIASEYGVLRGFWANTHWEEIRGTNSRRVDVMFWQPLPNEPQGIGFKGD